MSPEKDSARHIFDWQITPLAAVTAYLARDFDGVFERKDLFVCQDNGEVTHRVLGTRHPHDFKAPPDGWLTEAVIDTGYDAARSKFDHLASRFRRLLRSKGHYLYICTDARDDLQIGALYDLLTAASQGHEVHLLMVAFEPWSPAMSTFDGRVTRAWRPADNGKPPGQAWQGDDDAWDRILAPFDLAQ